MSNSDNSDENMKIDILNISEKYQSIIKPDSYSGENIEKLFNTLKILDKTVEQNNKKNLNFSKDKIKMKISGNNVEYNLDVRLGQGNFNKGIDNLINSSSTDLNRIKLPKYMKNRFDEFLNKKITKTTFSNLIANSYETGKSLADVGGEELNNFIDGFEKAFRAFSSKDENKQMNIIDKNIDGEKTKNIIENNIEKTSTNNFEKLEKKETLPTTSKGNNLSSSKSKNEFVDAEIVEPQAKISETKKLPIRQKVLEAKKKLLIHKQDKDKGKNRSKGKNFNKGIA